MFSNMVRGVFFFFFLFSLHHFGFWRSRRPRQQQSSMTYWKWIVCASHAGECRPIWLAILWLYSSDLCWIAAFSKRIYTTAHPFSLFENECARESYIPVGKVFDLHCRRPSKSESGTQRLLDAAQQLLSFFLLSRNVFETFVTCRRVKKSHSRGSESFKETKFLGHVEKLKKNKFPVKEKIIKTRWMGVHVQ